MKKLFGLAIILSLTSCGMLTSGYPTNPVGTELPTLEKSSKKLVLALEKPGVAISTTYTYINWLRGPEMKDGAEMIWATQEGNNGILFRLVVTPKTGSWQQYWVGDLNTYIKENQAALTLFEVGEANDLDDGFDTYYTHYVKINSYRTEKSLDYYSERTIQGSKFRCLARNLTQSEIRVVREICRSMKKLEKPAIRPNATK